jgi:hypothetical protein
MKKDYDRLAAIEKAISEKYGKLATQDFRSFWEPEKEEEYLKQLKERRQTQENTKPHEETIEVGNITIKRKNKNQSKNRTCPVCKTYSFSLKDDLYMNRFSCCYRCYVDFVEQDEAAWKRGDRPENSYMQQILRGRK